jgi:hypothetical protein
MKHILFGTLALLFTLTVQAHDTGHSCQMVQALANELGCSLNMPASTPIATDNDFLVTNSFGPTQCKTGDALKVSLRELRDDCNAWLKERKVEMGGKYQTGTCNDDCSDCGASLRTCTVKGIVHYAKPK